MSTPQNEGDKASTPDKGKTPALEVEVLSHKRSLMPGAWGPWETALQPVLPGSPSPAPAPRVGSASPPPPPLVDVNRMSPRGETIPIREMDKSGGPMFRHPRVANGATRYMMDLHGREAGSPEDLQCKAALEKLYKAPRQNGREVFMGPAKDFRHVPHSYHYPQSCRSALSGPGASLSSNLLQGPIPQEFRATPFAAQKPPKADVNASTTSSTKCLKGDENSTASPSTEYLNGDENATASSSTEKKSCLVKMKLATPPKSNVSPTEYKPCWTNGPVKLRKDNNLSSTASSSDEVKPPSTVSESTIRHNALLKALATKDYADPSPTAKDVSVTASTSNKVEFDKEMSIEQRINWLSGQCPSPSLEFPHRVSPLVCCGTITKGCNNMNPETPMVTKKDAVEAVLPVLPKSALETCDELYKQGKSAFKACDDEHERRARNLKTRMAAISMYGQPNKEQEHEKKYREAREALDKCKQNVLDELNKTEIGRDLVAERDKLREELPDKVSKEVSKAEQKCKNGHLAEMKEARAQFERQLEQSKEEMRRQFERQMEQSKKLGEMKVEMVTKSQADIAQLKKAIKERDEGIERLRASNSTLLQQLTPWKGEHKIKDQQKRKEILKLNTLLKSAGSISQEQWLKYHSKEDEKNIEEVGETKMSQPQQQTTPVARINAMVDGELTQSLITGLVDLVEALGLPVHRTLTAEAYKQEMASPKEGPRLVLPPQWERHDLVSSLTPLSKSVREDQETWGNVLQPQKTMGDQMTMADLLGKIRENSTLQRANTQLKEENATLQRSITECRERNGKLSWKCGELHDKHVKLDKQLGEQDEKHLAAEKTHEQEMTKMSEKMKQLVKEISQEREKLEVQMQEEQRAMEESKYAIKKISQEKGKLEAQLQEKQRALDACSSKVEDMKTVAENMRKSKAEDMKTMVENMKNIRAKNIDLQAQIEESKKQAAKALESVQAQLNYVMSRNKELENEVMLKTKAEVDLQRYVNTMKGTRQGVAMTYACSTIRHIEQQVALEKQRANLATRETMQLRNTLSEAQRMLVEAQANEKNKQQQQKPEAEDPNAKGGASTPSPPLKDSMPRNVETVSTNSNTAEIRNSLKSMKARLDMHAETVAYKDKEIASLRGDLKKAHASATKMGVRVDQLEDKVRSKDNENINLKFRLEKQERWNEELVKENVTLRDDYHIVAQSDESERCEEDGEMEFVEVEEPPIFESCSDESSDSNSSAGSDNV